MISIGNKRGCSTTEHTDTEDTVREWHRRLYASTFDNLDKMDNFLEKHTLRNFIQEELDNLSSPMSIKEIEFVIKHLPTNNKIKQKNSG